MNTHINMNIPQEEASPELLPFQSEAVAELHELVS